MKKININNIDTNTAVFPEHFDIAYPVKLKELEKGEFFITSLKSRIVYRKEEYDREERKYYCANWEDSNNGKYYNGDKIVYFGFEY